MANEQLVLQDTNDLSDSQDAGVDYTAIIKIVIEKITLYHAASMDKIAENISTQQRQILEQNNKIEYLWNLITSLTKFITPQYFPRWG